MVKHIIEITIKENKRLQEIKLEWKMGNINEVIKKFINDHELTTK